MIAAFTPDLAWLNARRDRPLSVAHRGASFYANENTLTAFQRAAELNADFWEVDLRLTADDICIACHDADLGFLGRKEIRIRENSYADILEASVQAERPIPRLEDIIALSQETDTGLYLDVKAVEAAPFILQKLEEFEVSKAVFGTTSPDLCRQLKADHCPWPVAILIPPRFDPFDAAKLTQADIVHLCWEHASPKPQELLTPDLLQRAHKENLHLMLWHEERPAILRDLLVLPVLGICSDRPEMLKPYMDVTSSDIQVVCHRGAHTIAPENTLPAIDAAFSAGFSHVEIDVFETEDKQLVVIHDYQLDRTTDGCGAVGDMTLEEIRALDAGSWFDPIYQGIQVPFLEEVIDLAKAYGRQLYIELKLADPAKVLQLVEHKNFIESCFFWSYDQAKLKELRRLSAKAQIMSRRQDYPSLEEAIASYDANIIEFHHTLANHKDIEQCRSCNVQTMIAYAGDNPEEMEKLVDLSPHFLNVDFPFLLHRLVS